MSNPRRFWVNASWTAAAIGIAMISVSLGLAIDMSRGGGALIAVGLLLALSGVGCALAFRSDAAKFDELVSGRRCLARWRFSPGEWSKFRAAELVEESHSKRGLAALVTVLSVVIGLPVALADRRATVPVLVVLGLVCGLCWALALTLPERRLAPEREDAEVEVLIGPDGVALPGEFHCWTGFAARLTGATLREEGTPVIVVDYRVYQRHGANRHTVRLPVPAGAMADAQRVVRELAALARG